MKKGRGNRACSGRSSGICNPTSVTRILQSAMCGCQIRVVVGTSATDLRTTNAGFLVFPTRFSRRRSQVLLSQPVPPPTVQPVSWCLRGEESGLLVTGYRLLATLAAAEGRAKPWCLCGLNSGSALIRTCKLCHRRINNRLEKQVFTRLDRCFLE